MGAVALDADRVTLQLAALLGGNAAHDGHGILAGARTRVVAVDFAVVLRPDVLGDELDGVVQGVREVDDFLEHVARLLFGRRHQAGGGVLRQRGRLFCPLNIGGLLSLVTQKVDHLAGVGAFRVIHRDFRRERRLGWRFHSDIIFLFDDIRHFSVPTFSHLRAEVRIYDVVVVVVVRALLFQRRSCDDVMNRSEVRRRQSPPFLVALLIAVLSKLSQRRLRDRTAVVVALEGEPLIHDVVDLVQFADLRHLFCLASLQLDVKVVKLFYHLLQRHSLAGLLHVF